MKALIIEKTEIISGVFKLSLYSQELAQASKPGQFLHINCGNNSFLRRPISISDVKKEENIVEIIFGVKGTGTQELANIKIKEELDILGPLGNSFTISDKYKKPAVVGGGIGIFPLLMLTRELHGQASIHLGFRNSENVLLENEFKQLGANLYISTDDGSYGHNGRVTDLLEKRIKEGKVDIIYACGPKLMLAAVIRLSEEYNIPCQISLEERMACGIGACLGCACKTKTDDDWNYKHVCKNGPVFWASEVMLYE